MTLYAFSGAIETGLLYALLALGVLISFRIMKIPDLTVDGSFTTGAAAAAVLTVSGHPYLAIPVAFAVGFAAGSVTALLHTKLKIPPVLSGILTMTALYSVNLLIMNNQASVMIPNKMKTVFSDTAALRSIPFGNVIIPFLLTAVIALLLIFFFKTTTGLSVRATGDNEVMVRSSSINTDLTKWLALSLSNGLTALCGGFIVQQQNYCDIKMGSGAIVLGLAALILGETLTKGKKSITRNIIAALTGSVVYQIVISFAIAVNISSSYLKLISAVIVVAAVSFPTVRENLRNKINQRSRMVKRDA